MTTTRRQFLTNVLLAVPVATVASLSTVAALETKTEAESCADISASHPLGAIPHPIPAVNDWLTKLDTSLEPITAFRDAIATARRHTINIPEMVNLHLKAFAAADQLDSNLERAGDVLECLAGQEIQYSDYLSDDYIAPPPPIPFGPPSRTALIDRCAQKIDETLVTLERFHSFLLEARALPPSQVDGSKWIKLEYAVIDAELELDNAMQSSSFFEDALEAATGKRSYYWCLKADIIGNEKIDAAFVQSEINAFREDYPGQVAELQALLDARLEVLR